MLEKHTKLEKDFGIEWQEYKLGEIFTIEKTLSFNKDKLTKGFEFDYVTRTSQKQGVLQTTGFVNSDNINKEGTWSLGLLQMDFFYRDKPWYAGQFVRLVRPTFSFNRNVALYFSVLMNKQKKHLLSGLVRDVDEKFLSSVVYLPTKSGEIALDYMDQFIASFKTECVATLKRYLKVTGLEDYHLTSKEKVILGDIEHFNWKEFTIEDVLTWQTQISELNPLHLNSLSLSTEEVYPFYGQATQNNGIIKYLHLQDDVLNNKTSSPTILIHSNNQNIVYLDSPFYLKDGHGATSVLQAKELNKMNSLFIMSAIKKVIKKKYSYNSKATKVALKNTSIFLPVNSCLEPDYELMEKLVTIVQKVVIKNAVLFADREIALTYGFSKSH